MRVARVVVERGPEWLDEDQDAALEWQEYDASLCSGCHHPRDESFAKENDDKYTAEVLTCHACASKDRLAHNRSQSREKDTPPPAGEYFTVRLDPD